MSTLVVIDKETGIAIDPQVAPVNGDWVQKTLNNGTIVRYEYNVTEQSLPNIRIITTRAFMQRLELSERVALRASSDYIVIDMMEDLRMATYVDLDEPALAFGLAYLAKLTEAPSPVIDTALIAVTQVSDMVLDGTPAEAYLGIL